MRGRTARNRARLAKPLSLAATRSPRKHKVNRHRAKCRTKLAEQPVRRCPAAPQPPSSLHHRPAPDRPAPRLLPAARRPRAPAPELAAQPVVWVEYPAAPARRSRATRPASQPERRRPAVNRLIHCSRGCSSLVKVYRAAQVSLHSRWPRLNRRRNNRPRLLRQHRLARPAAHPAQARLPSVPRRQRAVAVPWVAPQLAHPPPQPLRWALLRRHLRLHRSHNPDRAAP
ncbi:hypothetical protein MAUB1S_02918 [Mycolicibacterium aubagnense]